MKTPIIFHIPEPCHENWDAMTPQDKGRHCESCNKIVVDFSIMSDRQVLEYFKTTIGKTCGRFHEDQLQRPFIEPQQKPSKWNYFLASILGLIIGTKTFAQQKTIKGKVIGKPYLERITTKGDISPIKGEAKVDTIKINVMGDTVLPLKEMKEVLVQVPSSTAKNTVVIGGVHSVSAEELKKKKVNSITEVLDGLIAGVSNKIQGKIINEKNEVIAGASIVLKGTKIGTVSDAAGSYEMKKLASMHKLVLVIYSIGFETKEIEIVPKDLKGELNIVLKESKTELKEVVLETNATRHKGGATVRVVCFRYRELAPLMVQKIFNKESIKVYPNPARKNDIIHITIKDAGEYALHLFDVQSKLLVVKAIVTNTNNQTTEFQLPSTASTGTYFIRILNEKTQKQVTEKIIIQ